MPEYSKDKKSKKKSQEKNNDDLFSYIDKKVQDSMGQSTIWASNQAKFNRMRLRIKKAKTFPFIGCSNIKMPTADTKIRKIKAALANVVFGVRPVVQVIPTPSGNLETAMKIEKFLDHMIMDVIKLKNKGVIAIDQALESGFFLLKPYWKVEITKRQEKFDLDDVSIEEAMYLFDGKTTQDMVTQWVFSKYDIDNNSMVIEDNEKSAVDVSTRIMKGETDFDFYVQDVLYNAPDVGLIAPEKCYVPSDSGYNPQDCQCIINEFYMPYHELEMNAEYKGWNKDGIDDIGGYKNYDVRTLKDQQKDLAEGITRLNENSGMVRVWEYYGWYDLNNDGIAEKVCITCAPDFSKILRKIGLPFNNGKFPIVKIFYELREDRWYSHRGVCEMAEDIIKEIDIQHNMKIDQQTIRNAPMYLYRSGMVNPNLVQMLPNQAIPVKGTMPLTDVVTVLNANNPNVEFSYEREQQILESKLEELFGQIDFTLQSMINKRQPRTLGEVEHQVQSSQQVFSLDADLVIGQFSELFSFIWDLWCQYGEDEEEFEYFGPDGWEKIKLSKEEVQGKYRVTVRGNDNNTNPGVKMQKAQQILQAVLNPMLLQTGVITPVQMVNGIKRFYQTLDIEGWEQFVNVNVQPPQPPQPPPVGAIVTPKFEDLTDAEQAQVLGSIGVQPDIQGRAMDKNREINKEVSETMENMRQSNGTR